MVIDNTEYNPVQVVMEQLDDDLRRRNRDAQAYTDEAPSELPSISDFYQSLGPDTPSRIANAISLAGIPLAFTPFSPVGDALELGAAGFHYGRSKLVDDPTLAQKLEAEALGQAIAAIPGPIGGLSKISRVGKGIDQALQGTGLRRLATQSAAGYAGARATDAAYPDEEPFEEPLEIPMDQSSVGAVPTLSPETSDVQDDMTASDAMTELEKLLKKKNNIGLSGMYYNRGVDPFTVAFRRDNPSGGGQMVYNSFDQVAANIESSILNENVGRALSPPRVNNPVSSYSMRRRRPQQSQSTQQSTQQGTQRNTQQSTQRNTSQDTNIQVPNPQPSRLERLAQVAIPSGGLAALVLAASAPGLISRLLPDESGEQTTQSLVPRIGGGGSAAGQSGMVPGGQSTLVDKLQGSLGLVQGFNPAMATINAIIRRST